MNNPQEAIIHRLIAQDYAARIYLSFHEEPIPFERDGTTYSIVTGNLTNRKVVAKLDGEKQYETLEINDQEATYFQEYCYRQLYETYANDERTRQCQADEENTEKQVASACSAVSTPSTDELPDWQATLTDEQRQYIRMAQQIALDEAEQHQLVETENQRLRQHIGRIEEIFDTTIDTLTVGDGSPTMIPYPLYAKERERRFQAERQQDRLFANPSLKPAQKLGLHYLQRQVERGKTHDRQGRTRINATTIAKHMGMSPSTGERFVEFCKEQLPDLVDWAKHPEIGPDGSEIERTYIKFPNQELLQNPEHITPVHFAKQGGDRYICPLCGSKHVTIKRKVTRTLICEDCKHTIEIDTTETEHTFEDDRDESEKQVASARSARNIVSNIAAHKKISAEESNLPDIIKPFTPPMLSKLQDTPAGDDNQEVQDGPLSCDEQEAAIALYQAIAGVDSGHIEMIPKSQKWTKVHEGITALDILAHVEGRKTIGTRLYHEGGWTRAFLVDADSEEDLERLRAGAQKLAAAGFFPILDSPPADRPRQVEGFHDVSAHGWIVMDALVSRSAGWAELVRLAPEWGEFKECWPKLSERPVGNRVRLPGGNYVMPGFAGFSLLASVCDGECAQTGVDQARLLLAHLSPASLIPSGSCGAGGECKEEQVGLLAASAASGGSKELCTGHRAGGDRPWPVVDEQWVQKYGPVETTTLFFAVTEAYGVAWFNERNPLESLRPRQQNGKAISPNGDERTASTGYYDTAQGERYTDFSTHGLRADGSHDGGDAFELACKLWGRSKSELSKETMREILRQARAEMEAAAHAGREPAAEVCALTTPAGWCYYDCLQFNIGDLVTWCYVPRGGYGAVYPVDGEVTKVGTAKVTIRVCKKDGSQVERAVSPEHLVPRQPEQPAPCTIYVDDIQTYNDTPLPYKRWCHLAIAGPVEELHAFARQLGLKREWFQDKPTHPHYDLTPAKRAQAIKLGAVAVSTLDLVKRCYPDMVLSVPVLEQKADATLTQLGRTAATEEHDGYEIDEDGDYLF